MVSAWSCMPANYPMNVVLYVFIGYTVVSLVYFSFRATRDLGLAQCVVEEARKGQI